MHRLTLDACSAAMAAVMMASLVLLGGAAIEPASVAPLAGRFAELAGDEAGRCVSAPVMASPDWRAEGTATLCDVGRAVRLTIEAPTLRPGQPYTAVMVYAPRPAPCEYPLCPPTSLLGDSQGGLADQLGDGILPLSGTIELYRAGTGLRLLSGTQVALVLQSPGSGAQPLARAMFRAP